MVANLVTKVRPICLSIYLWQYYIIYLWASRSVYFICYSISPSSSVFFYLLQYWAHLAVFYFICYSITYASSSIFLYLCELLKVFKSLISFPTSTL